MSNQVYKWWVLVATGIMIMLVNLDLIIVNLAVADMAKAFNASLSQVQWILLIKYCKHNALK